MQIEIPAKELSIVIPYYNDAGCPRPFITALQNELEGIDYELILVDDGSTDSTPEEMDKLAGKRVAVFHNQENKDYGGAIMTGLSQAQGSILCFTCGDGEISPRQIVDVFSERKDLDVIKALREHRKDGLKRIVMTKVFNLFCRARFGVRLKDTNGYPVFMKRGVYESVANIRTDWLFNIDLYRKILAANYTIAELPVKHQDRMSGKSHMTMGRIFKMVLKLFVYR